MDYSLLFLHKHPNILYCLFLGLFPHTLAYNIVLSFLFTLSIPQRYCILYVLIYMELFFCSNKSTAKRNEELNSINSSFTWLIYSAKLSYKVYFHFFLILKTLEIFVTECLVQM